MRKTRQNKSQFQEWYPFLFRIFSIISYIRRTKIWIKSIRAFWIQFLERLRNPFQECVLLWEDKLDIKDFHQTSSKHPYHIIQTGVCAPGRSFRNHMTNYPTKKPSWPRGWTTGSWYCFPGHLFPVRCPGSGSTIFFQFWAASVLSVLCHKENIYWKKIVLVAARE